MARPGIDDGAARGSGPGPIADRRAPRRGSGRRRPVTDAANENGPPAPRCASAFPYDAVAIVEPWPVAANQSGRARHNDWRVRFAPRAKPFADPLTGWTGGCDPLAHVELRFSSRDAAERHCMRQGLRFESRPRPSSRPVAAESREGAAGVAPPCCWPTGPHPLCCGDFPILRQREPCAAGGWR